MASRHAPCLCDNVIIIATWQFTNIISRDVYCHHVCLQIRWVIWNLSRVWGSVIFPPGVEIFADILLNNADILLNRLRFAIMDLEIETLILKIQKKACHVPITSWNTKLIVLAGCQWHRNRGSHRFRSSNCYLHALNWLFFCRTPSTVVDTRRIALSSAKFRFATIAADSRMNLHFLRGYCARHYSRNRFCVISRSYRPTFA